MKSLFVHSADWHLGASTNFIPNALARQEEVIEKIYRKAEKRGCKIIVVVGDILQRHNPTRAERDLLLKIILKKDDEGFTTIITEGNHDREEAQYTNIHFLSLLEKSGRLKNTFIIENWPKLIKVNKMSFLAIPKGSKDPNKIIKKYRKEKNVIVLIHDTIKNGRYDSGYVTKTGIEFQKHKNVIYYAFGHLHTFQKMWDNAYYCGSPCQHNFGEKGKKGFLLVDYKNPTEPSFVKIKSKRLVEVKDGEELPKDAWVRLISNKPTLDLPDNVIDVSQHHESFKPIKINLSDMTSGLPEFLAKEGLSKNEQKIGIKMVRKVLERI